VVDDESVDRDIDGFEVKAQGIEIPVGEWIGLVGNKATASAVGVVGIEYRAAEDKVVATSEACAIDDGMAVRSHIKEIDEIRNIRPGKKSRWCGYHAVREQELHCCSTLFPRGRLRQEPRL
jgi:hypothetical protein